MNQPQTRDGAAASAQDEPEGGETTPEVRPEAPGEPRSAFELAVEQLGDAVDTDDDGRISAREVVEAGERVARVEVPTVMVTMPAAAMELIAALLTLNHALEAPDMVALIYAIGFGVGLFLIIVFHYLVATERPILLWFFLLWKTLVSLSMAAAIWERHQPHQVWDGVKFVTTASSEVLAASATLMTLVILGLLVFRLVLSTGRFMWGVRDA